MNATLALNNTRSAGKRVEQEPKSNGRHFEWLLFDPRFERVTS